MKDHNIISLAAVLTYGSEDHNGGIGKYYLSKRDVSEYVSRSSLSNWYRVCFEMGYVYDSGFMYSLARPYEKSPVFAVVSDDLVFSAWKEIKDLPSPPQEASIAKRLEGFADSLKRAYLSLPNYREGIHFGAALMEARLGVRLTYRDLFGLLEDGPCLLRDLVRELGKGPEPHLRMFVGHEMHWDWSYRNRRVNTGIYLLGCVADEHLRKWRSPHEKFSEIYQKLDAVHDFLSAGESGGSSLKSIGEPSKMGRPYAIDPSKIVAQKRVTPILTDQQIARRLKISRQTVRRALDKAGL